jgi:Tfp pilus assembly protein PilN
MAGTDTATRHPLDDVMLAMDVVDTLRHRQLLVERELNTEAREQTLIKRLREIYAAQGIDVPDHVLAEGVAALDEERFVYTPPEPGWRVTLAHLYITRGTWGKALLAILAMIIAVAIVYTTMISGPQQRRLAALPGELATQRQAIIELTEVPEARERAQQYLVQGQAALREEDADAAGKAVVSLKELRAQLEHEYTVRIVSRPGESSGVWRMPDVNTDARNYYIIVEAVTADGSTLTLPVRNEEDGKIYKVNKWALRVSEQLYEQIAADKSDDGIIQQRDFGVKRRGQLTPDYAMPTTGAALTDW